jgi:flagellar operon protein (TIGR03826 family)
MYNWYQRLDTGGFGMALNVDNCPRCGKVYVINAQRLCHNCIKDIEQQYEKCVKYLRDNRSCTLQELSDATDVPIKQISKFIREGRISIKDNPNMSIDCEVCGAPIREGIMCESCRSRFVKEADKLAEDGQRKQQAQEKYEGMSFKIKDRLQDRLK